MVNMYRVRTVWTGVPGTPWYSNFYFGAVVESSATCQDAVHDMWTGLTTRIMAGVTATTQGEVAVIDSVTGKAVAFEGGTDQVQTFTGTGEPLPSATQGLVRLQTADVQNGRRVRGRLFIPRPTESSSVNGLPEAVYVAAIRTAILGLINANIDYGVWSRKNGTFSQVTGASGWNQWAVQRSRRD